VKVISAALAVLLPVSPSQAAEATHTQLCKVVARPAAYGGKRVTFDADILTDWQHGIVLTDRGCKGGVQLTSTDAVSDAQNAALDDAVGMPLTGGYTRTARATFTGKFYWKPARAGQQTQFYNARQFMAEAVTNVSTQQR
jgi:hypothetical protein